MITLSSNVASSSSDLLALVQLLNTKGIDKTLVELRDLSKAIIDAQTDLDMREATVKKAYDTLVQDQANLEVLTAQRRDQFEAASEQTKKDKATVVAAQADLTIRKYDTDQAEAALTKRQAAFEALQSSRESAVSAREATVKQRETEADALIADYTTKRAALLSAIG